jgi:hypothetical protein
MVRIPSGIAELVAERAIEGDGVWKLAEMACEMDADANGVIEGSSPVATAGAIEVNDVDPAISGAAPESGPHSGKTMRLDLLSEISAGTIIALPHYLCR